MAAEHVLLPVSVCDGLDEMISNTIEAKTREGIRACGDDVDTKIENRIRQDVIDALPEWMREFRSRARAERYGWGEETSQGRIPTHELEAFAELRRLILHDAHGPFAEAIKELKEFVPEGGYSRLPFEDDYGRPEADFPFFTEAVTYALFGKDDARTLLAKMRRLERLLG